MAVQTESGGVRDLGFGGRVQHLATQSTPAFAIGSLVVPLLFVAVVGPSLGALDNGVAAAVTARLIPNAAFFLVGFSLATVLSGTLLTGMGLSYGFTGFWPNLALGRGCGLFAFGLLVPNRMHLRAIDERTVKNPDESVLEAIEKRNIVIGLFEAAAMLAIILIMTGMRLGINVREGFRVTPLLRGADRMEVPRSSRVVRFTEVSHSSLTAPSGRRSLSWPPDGRPRTAR